MNSKIQIGENTLQLIRILPSYSQLNFQKPALSHSIKILILLLCLYTALLTCWIGDDALITLKQIWNFVNGEGITLNYDQRVHAFSHPLWFIILSIIIKFSNEVFVTHINCKCRIVVYRNSNLYYN